MQKTTGKIGRYKMCTKVEYSTICTHIQTITTKTANSCKLDLKERLVRTNLINWIKDSLIVNKVRIL